MARGAPAVSVELAATALADSALHAAQDIGRLRLAAGDCAAHQIAQGPLALLVELRSLARARCARLGRDAGFLVLGRAHPIFSPRARSTLVLSMARAR